jgi:hypothetical protein
MLATTTLGAALLGLSGVLLALDVGGTVALDAENAAATRAADPVSAARPAAESPVAASIPAAAAQVPPVRADAALRRQIDAPAPASAPKMPPPVRAETHPYVTPASIRPPALIRTPPAIRRTISGPAEYAAVPIVAAYVHPAEAKMPPLRPSGLEPPPVAVALETEAAPLSVAQPPLPAAAPALSIATLRDVRHYAMKRLARKYPAVRVISAETYAVGGGCVRVQMVVRNGTQRWIEKDTVRRTGTELALLASAQHDLPYAVAPPARAAGADEGP